MTSSLDLTGEPVFEGRSFFGGEVVSLVLSVKSEQPTLRALDPIVVNDAEAASGALAAPAMC